MAFHVRIKEGCGSYSNGIFSATQLKRDVYLETKAAADEAVATGFFDYVGEGAAGDAKPEPDGDNTPKAPTEKNIDEMEYNELKKLAKEIGVVAQSNVKKDALVAMIKEALEDEANGGTGDDEDDDSIPDGIIGE